MFLLLGFSFLAGLITILTPCMWPMLPIVLSANFKAKDRSRPFGITLGVMASFAVFTLSISYLVRLLNFDPNLLRIFAVVVIIFMGFSLIIPSLSKLTEGFLSRFSGTFGKKRYVGNDFRSGFLTGLVLGIIWSPCGGPILASIAALSATGKVNLDVILVTIAYVCGVGLPLFIFTYAGSGFLRKVKVLNRYTQRIQKVFGFVMIVTALLILFNYDQLLQVKVLEVFPQLGQTLNGFEGSNTVTKQLDALKGKLASKNSSALSNDLLNTNSKAADFTGGDKWFNTPKPLPLKSLKGKVVLVDFWTYTCINCLRSLPFVTSWYDKYKSDGFVVIGVHTPEFQFEHDPNNVLNALKMFKISYPVVQDNEYKIWNSYNNSYWPAEYLIDKNGNVRRTHFGEGEYDKTEMAIRQLLQENGQKLTQPLDTNPDQTPKDAISPETYLGSQRMEYFYPDGNIGNTTSNFNLSNDLVENSFSFGGKWTINPEDAVTSANSTLNYNFVASKVFIILRPGQNKSGTVKVFLDNKLIDKTSAGADVQNGVLKVDSDRLYNIVDLHGQTENHLLRLEFQTPLLQAFTFTFG